MEELILNNLVKDYKLHSSIRYLSKKYDISKSTIYYNLSNLNIIKRQNIITCLKNKDELLIGVFIGLWIGDGSKFIDNNRYIIKFHFHKDNTNLANFIQKILYSLFGINARVYYDGGNKASIKIFSKFIYYFIDNYVNYKNNKTLTVHLKDKIYNYTNEFLDGLLLGFVLSDGSISNNTFTYSTISEKLTEDIKDILTVSNFNTIRHYVHNRRKYGWHDLNQISLNKNETKIIINKMNYTLIKLNCPNTLLELKQNKNL
jgi:hypothetical protein